MMSVAYDCSQGVLDKKIKQLVFKIKTRITSYLSHEYADEEEKERDANNYKYYRVITYKKVLKNEKR